MKQQTLLFILFALSLGLTGCSNAKKQLGLERSAPDEFSVVKRAPLAMPPNYILRPPSPGAPRPQEQSTNEQARKKVFGATSTQSKLTISNGVAENTLLQNAGGQYADPDIRQKIDSEALERNDNNKAVAERLLGIVRKTKPTANIVNAPEEAARIRQNIESGKKITEGETPSIED